MTSERKYLTPEQLQAEYEFAPIYGLDLLFSQLLRAFDDSLAEALMALVDAAAPGEFDMDELAGLCHLVTLHQRTRKSEGR